MRGVLAPTPCPVAALALAGCMGRTAPLAVVPQTSLDPIAYGQSYAGPAPMAVAYAGGFSPRDRRDRVAVTHTDASGTARYVVPSGTSLSPGDTVLIGERWF